ncbi:fatty acid metabolism transcriptional regulator FadR [Pseudidiomarina terrestris]|uniref:Fatty acid metabolism regulator protein n=1 Tax=Pseudidiomarina terrestris TaxID=2820060 RepID=A0ABT8MFX3_9GAMM|nr:MULTISPECIES: fatty acid metabolism transcriptional regulator FadR [unclassified Pseudidiomarina]MDN7127740.1 fatty acid metabolism transcriptional regulator FadR [Pseudidiomarina sp. 1APR75-33.1]MDN7128846.1 fatty acid metabolism transcriptional regulator FadR [Pseudidiomarina sp. 1APR75-15]MDN7134890.1 fatty acid metabolism transcriptional regulator FadR [Pseudidiomarina sp. 1ASP75-5]
MIIKAQSPAGFAEEYIVKSIWNGHFAPGTILPAERELSELIGVTRTTLREVLQRLARDGWLTIQHGKPTRVNNFWETSGLNILETLARLDEEGMPELVDQLLSARTNISAIYIRAAVRNAPERVAELLAEAEGLEDTADAFSEYDYRLNHDLAMASGNPIYVLVLNGFKGLYSRIGNFYFSNDDARKLARKYYADLKKVATEEKRDEAALLVRDYGYASGRIWHNLRGDIPANLIE